MRKIALLAGAGSAAMLLGALYFQYFMDLPPCKMCIWQRWPHGIAIALGLLAYFLPLRVFALLGAAIVLVGAAIAGYHAGVEIGVFEGPNSCTGGFLTAENIPLFGEDKPNDVVLCDEVVWSLFGLSMAAWNGIISLGLAGIWLFAFRKGTPA